MKTSSCSKSDNSQKMQNNICKRLQSSAQCVESTNHQLGNASSAKRFLVKIVFQSETIAKETTEVVQSSFTWIMPNTSLFMTTDKLKRTVFIEMSTQKGGKENKNLKDGNSVRMRFTTSLTQFYIHWISTKTKIMMMTQTMEGKITQWYLKDLDKLQIWCLEDLDKLKLSHGIMYASQDLSQDLQFNLPLGQISTAPETIESKMKKRKRNKR